MTVEQIKTYMQIGITIGEAVAPLTKTTIDDKIVDVAKQLVERDALLTLLVAIFGGGKADTAALSDEDKAVFGDAAPYLPGVKSLVEAGKAVCEG